MEQARYSLPPDKRDEMLGDKVLKRSQVTATIINDLVAAGVLLAGVESLRYWLLLTTYDDLELVNTLLFAHELREIAISSGRCLPV